METPSFWILPVAAYLLGSVPFGLVIGRFKGVDIRRHGSGNIGATNVARVVGKGYGLLTLLLDFLKGMVPVIVASRTGGAEMAAMTGSAAVLGHCFSVCLRFRGGKGVATAAGVFAAVSLPSLCVALAVFAGAVWATGYVSAGSLAASIALPVALYFFQPDPWLLGMGGLLAAVVWFKHRDNIRRLLRGEEKGIGNK